MERWKDFTIYNFRALKDIMQLWEKSNPIDPIDSVALPAEAVYVKSATVTEYKNKSQLFPPLQ